MNNATGTLKHFALMIWNDLILNRNGAGIAKNLQFVCEDAGLCRVKKN